MTRRTADPRLNGREHSFPLSPKIWEKVVKELQLPPQQLRIVELLLRRMKCKEIAASIGLGEPTLRTYLRRIYDRLRVDDQTELLIHIMELSQQVSPTTDGPPRE